MLQESYVVIAKIDYSINEKYESIEYIIHQVYV